jgi:hypothetical protein
MNLDTFLEYRKNCPLCNHPLIGTIDGSPFYFKGDDLIYETDFSGYRMSRRSFSYTLHIYINRYTNQFKIDIRDKKNRELNTVPLKRVQELSDYYHNEAKFIIIRGCPCNEYKYTSQIIRFSFYTKEVNSLSCDLGRVKTEIYIIKSENSVYHLVNNGNFSLYTENSPSLELPHLQIEGKSRGEIIEKLDTLLFFS